MHRDDPSSFSPEEVFLVLTALVAARDALSDTAFMRAEFAEEIDLIEGAIGVIEPAPASPCPPKPRLRRGD
jgi:hypothetical protein